MSGDIDVRKSFFQRLRHRLGLGMPRRATKMSGSANKTLRCSFCNKRQSEVKKLIAGPHVYICDECVDICNDVLADERIPGGRGLKVGMRAAAVVEEKLRTARVLLEGGETGAAARETKSAAVAALRALLVLAGEDPERDPSYYLLRDDDRECWRDLSIIARSLRYCPEVAALLHSRDSAHIILKSTLDGASLSSSDITTAMAVVSDLLSLLHTNAEAAQNIQG
jgi:hypothetical protein